MMKYVSGIIFSVILISLISLIFPSGKIGKYLKSIFSFILIFSVINPLLNLDEINVDFNNAFLENEVIYQEQYLDYVNQKKIDNYNDNCTKIIEKLGVKNAQIDFIYYTDEKYNLIVEKVNVNLKNSVISPENEHINIIKDIKKMLSEYLSVNQENIKVYE